MSAHTPGPWVVDDMTVYALHPDGSYVGKGKDLRPRMVNRFWIAVQGLECPYDERIANARLIAAAPDLLAALKGLLTPEPGGVYVTTVLENAARAAVRKAEGAA